MIMLKQESVSLKKASVSVVAPTSNYAHFVKQNREISCNADIDMSPDVHNARDSLPDLVSVTMDGEKHWVSGVDPSTTCTDLICALLSYKDLEGKSNEQLPIYHTLCHKLGRSIQTSSQNTSHKATLRTNTKENEQTSYSKGLNTNLHQYVIVKQLRDSRFEEYLDGSTRLMDVIPTADKLAKNQVIQRFQLPYSVLTEKTPTSSASSSSGILQSTLQRAFVIRWRTKCSRCYPCQPIRTAAWAVPWAVPEVNDTVEGVEKHIELAWRRQVQHYQSKLSNCRHSLALWIRMSILWIL